jgi:hypothetical protein
MLSFMRRKLCGLIVLLFCVSACLAQSRWPLPKLQELTQSDAIGRSPIQLSAEETTLLKHLTRKIISVCIEDPGPGDPHTASGMFNRVRVRGVSLTPEGNSDLVVQGFGVCMCGAVGNCPCWVISQHPHPTALMHAVGIQSFAFQKSVTTDHFDIVLCGGPRWLLARLDRASATCLLYDR